MTIRTIIVRQRGQMTLPSDVREDLGVKDGGKLRLEHRGNEWVLRPDDIVDRLAGALSNYATDEPLEWDREEIWTEIAMERDERVQQQVRQDEQRIGVSQGSGWARATAGSLPSRRGQIEPEELEELLERIADEEVLEKFGDAR